MVAHQTNPSGANQQCSSQNARHLPTCLLNTCINRAGRIGTSTPSELYMWGLGGTTRHTTNLYPCGQMEGVSCLLLLDGVARGLPHCWRLGLEAAAEVQPMLIFRGQVPGCVRPELFQSCLAPSATAHPLYLVIMLLCPPVVLRGEQELCTAPASRPHVLHRAP